MHDKTKVLLGAIRSSFKVVTPHVGTVQAGVAVRQKSDGTLSTIKADGNLIGVSVGKDLSDAGQVGVCRSGLLVPLLLTAEFVPVHGAQVHVDDATGLAKASGAGVTGVNATYNIPDGVLTGVKEDGTTALCATIDFQGGL